jgi:squalene-hopene/tetraprenyl-beta-curcumene cyclase
MRRLLVAAGLALFALPAPALGQVPFGYKPPDNPYPYAEDEPKAKSMSLPRAGDYLDGVANFWMQSHSCGACHANFAYVMARPVLEGPRPPLLDETRGFLKGAKKHLNFSFETHAVAIAFALAWDDAHTTGKLQTETRHALRRMWSLQQPQGSWRRLGCGDILPAENDPRYAAVLAALAAGVAPQGYAHMAEAQDGLTRLRRYFVKNPPRNHHDEAMLLWASLYLDGLLTTTERETTIKLLLSSQRADGGWRFDCVSATGGAKTPSDSYGTAFTIYILRQAGVPATRPELVRGIDWLRSQQRASGRWFTPSHAAGQITEGGVGHRDLYIQNLGTAFTLLALKACEASDGITPLSRRPLQRTAGLRWRDWVMAQ